MSSDIKVCTVRRLPPEKEVQAHRLAVFLNPLNAVVQSGPARGAMTVAKKWPVGRTITVAFLDGTPVQRARVQPYFHEWSKYANLKFAFVPQPAQADASVSFRSGEGSWSYVGVDCLLQPKGEPTMVLGWLEDGTEESEYGRVTRHEVGHLVGFEHELESPASAVKWDVDKVLAYYMGPPNNWTKEDVYQQVLDKIAPQGVDFTPFDPHSIMCYFTPPEFTTDGVGTPENVELSPMDKAFAAQMYPGTPVVVPTPPQPVIPNVSVPQVKPGGPEIWSVISDLQPIAEFAFSVPAYGTYRVWTSYVDAPVLLFHPGDPNRPLVVARQTFTSNVPAGDYRIRVMQASPGQLYRFRIDARRLP